MFTVFSPSRVFSVLSSARVCAMVCGVVACAALMCACGKKGPVMPLEARLPAAPSEVSLSQRGSSLLLAWNIPTHNQDGSELKNLKRFDIYRIDYDPEGGCPECRNPQYLLQRVDVDFYQSKNRNSKRIYMWDHFVEAGTGYRYRIVPITQEEQPGADATIHRPCFRAPEPPTALRVRSSDRQVILSWDAPPLKNDTLAGYNIYRSKAGEYFGTRPLNRKPLSTTTYEDLNLNNHVPYRYTVRSVVKQGEYMIESDSPPALEATPVPPQ